MPRPRASSHPLLLLALAFLLCPLSALAAKLSEAFETPYNLSASRILPPELLSGPHHRVEEQVENDGYMNTYRVRSRYGPYRVVSTALLAVRVREFEAMAAMDKVAGGEQFGKSVLEGGESVLKGVANLVTSPVETLESAASGVGKLFARAEEGISGSPPSNHEDSTGAKLTGFASTRRALAVAFGVDPYTTNEPLRKRLSDLAAAGYTGQLTSMGLKALIPGGVGLAVSGVSSVNWLGEVDLAQPPSDLRMKNRADLERLKTPSGPATAFMDNREYTPTQQTLTVRALSAMGGPGGLDVFLRLAASTENQDQALFRTRMARMYAGYARKVDALKGFVALGRLAGAKAASGRLVLCFPLDHLCWTPDVARLATDIEAGRERVGAGPVELWVTGTVSQKVRSLFAARGWTVHEKAGKELLDEDF
ncbi:hypothetical protein NNJEOMEG_01037 [Fundidesulfovibrio magnetotacticus]|uniref:Uncharacterized protein n=1 Tax=Fundidesulfovibrio magnetotacticus TaxID=2730080 RepID=A0A6V8LTS7_9BACT|nr:hypothetical protein [Fundidesulfovibrio magnetotacticus]GFK93206.1 hypothetical protein NNJEOMEG_01037 [Fundidesulfovibrio magnetotacticus]